MTTRILAALLTLAVLLASAPGVMAREGDTLEPVSVSAPALETYPTNLLPETEFGRIQERAQESRNAGAPVAVRIVDLSIPQADLPFQVRQYVTTDFSEPVPESRQQHMLDSWIRSEPVETSAGADDGFLLLVLVPEDRTQTLALWRIGENALPLNGLTEENIMATNTIMSAAFVEGNVANGVFLGMSEFGYNVQFGVPERLELSEMGKALNTAVIPLAIATAIAALAVPVAAWWLGRRQREVPSGSMTLTPWHAAALHAGRANANIPAAVLLDAYHQGALQQLADGSVSIHPGNDNAAVKALQPFADTDGVVPAAAMYEIASITEPIQHEIEAGLIEAGYFSPSRIYDRGWMLIVMGAAVFGAAMSVVPAIVGMSRIGIFAAVLAIVCVLFGWWWLRNRRFTTDRGADALATWLNTATPADLARYETATEQHLLTDQAGGPSVSQQTRLVRRLRGLGAG